jgi:hypothetical protein
MQLDHDLAIALPVARNAKGAYNQPRPRPTRSAQQRTLTSPQVTVTVTWSSVRSWLVVQLCDAFDWLRERMRWLLRCERNQRCMSCAAIGALTLLVALTLGATIRQYRAWAFLPGRGGVTLFYELLMCPPGTVTAGGRQFSYRAAKTAERCFGDAVAASSGRESAAPTHRMPSLDVILRLDDGYRAGDAYLPVVLLGQGEYALLTISVIDALRRPVYAPVTLQFGPDERYPYVQPCR